MNCPSRTDNVDGREGWNQNPNALSDATREDINGMANTRVLRRIDSDDAIDDTSTSSHPTPICSTRRKSRSNSVATLRLVRTLTGQSLTMPRTCDVLTPARHDLESSGRPPRSRTMLQRIRDVVTTFGKFVGPGFMISVAYIDPGNYATDVAAGASYRFQLLFIVLVSNIIAIYLQSLCVKLGTVTGMNLAEMCRAHLPKWLNFFLYFMAEAAIIATDLAEVIGTAIAINLLIPQIPLVAGCALSIVDVLLILIFYRPNGSMKGLRAFEMFVVALVLAVVICFIVQLTLIRDTSVGEVFRGYLPSSAIIQSDGLYQACGILGATVMPHSLYLGSGIVQPRLLDYDIQAGHVAPPSEDRRHSIDSGKMQYVPSLSAINFCMKYSIAELSISLFTFALFVNSAILIVAGASLSDIPDSADADLFSIHSLLSTSIAPAAGTIFALALLLSGISAGIVCTIAGQMVSEGAINWSISPWQRRLITRSISITPSIIVAGAVGKDGLSAALNGSQVALSVVLPFVSAPIIYFTARNKFMTVKTAEARLAAELAAEGHGGSLEEGDELRVRSTASSVPAAASADATALASANANDADPSAPSTSISGILGGAGTKMANSWLVTGFACLIWGVIVAMNVANLVLLGLGAGG